MTSAIIIDLITISLLIATIFYALVLNKRIVSIQDNKSELTVLMKGFSTTLSIAESSVEKLRYTGSETIEKLAEQAKQAKQLKEDLEYLIERGDKLANSLEDMVRKARSESTVFKNFEDRRMNEAKKPVFLEELTENINTYEDPEEAISEVKKRLIGKLQALR